MQSSQGNRKLSAEEIRRARKAIGASVEELAALLRMEPNGDRKIRRWETGDEEISGPASVAIEALASGWRP